MVIAPTYKVLSGASIKSFLENARLLGVLHSYAESKNIAILTNGAEIAFRSAENPDHLRGPNLSGCWLDEASQMKREVFEIMIGRLREKEEQGWMTATFTPQGKTHWTYEIFGEQSQGARLFHTSTLDNPFLPETFYGTVKDKYSPLLARQELGGEFVMLEGCEWPAEWFDDSIWFDDWPHQKYWLGKYCALDPSKGAKDKLRKGKKGDYSCFIKMIFALGKLWVEADMSNTRNLSVITDDACEIQRTFKSDGFAIEVNQFQELLADNIAKRATELGILFPCYPLDNRVNKEVRIRRLTPYLSKSMIRFKSNSPGTSLLVSQLQEFPQGDYDDGCDALEMAIRIANDLITEMPLRQERIIA